MRSLILRAGLAGLLLCAARTLPAAEIPVVTFEEVRPVLARHCGKCHTAERPRGELDLSSLAAIQQGGTSGKVVVAGKAEQSLLYTLTAHLEDPKMPPNSPKIPQRELDLLKHWIDGGLREKATTVSAAPPAKEGKPPAATTGAPPAKGLVPAQPLPRATAITALATHPTEALHAVSGFKQVLLLEALTGKVRGALAFPEGEVHALRFSRDGKLLLAAGGRAGAAGVVVGFDFATGERRFSIAGEADTVLAADLSADGQRVAFGGPGRVVQVARVSDGKKLHGFRKPTDWVLSVAFSPDGLLVAAGDRFGGLTLWEAESGKEFLNLRGHAKGVNALAFSPDGDRLYSGGEDGTIRCWDLHTGTEAHRWAAHEGGTLDLACDRNERLVSVGRDRRVQRWDAKGTAQGTLPPLADVTMKVAVSGDGSRLLAGDWSGNLREWSGLNPTPQAITLPRKQASTVAQLAAVPVPLPPATPVAAAPPAQTATPVSGTEGGTPTGDDLTRKRLTLKLLEESAERLKEEAARNPRNPGLAKAYLQTCEAVLAIKTDLLEAEARLRPAK